MQRRGILSAMLALMAALPMAATPTAALAQNAFPSQPLRIVVPFPAGGIVDIVARIVGQKMSEKYGQPVIVDNKPGAGGSIGTAMVAHAAPDGYTMLMLGTGFVVLPHLMKNLPWSPTDFHAVMEIGSVPNILVVPAQSPIKSLKDLLDAARRAPGTITYGSPGIGSSPHLSGELLAQMAGVKMVHVPYKGQPPAVTDLLAGRISMMALSAALAGPYLKSGRLRALGVTPNSRIASHPELPTIAELAKLPDYDVRPWTSVFVPARTPDAVTKKLAADMKEIVELPEVKKKLEAVGMELNPVLTSAFDAQVAAEGQRWAEVLHKAGIVAQ